MRRVCHSRIRFGSRPWCGCHCTAISPWHGRPFTAITQRHGSMVTCLHFDPHASGHTPAETSGRSTQTYASNQLTQIPCAGEGGMGTASLRDATTPTTPTTVGPAPVLVRPEGRQPARLWAGNCVGGSCVWARLKSGLWACVGAPSAVQRRVHVDICQFHDRGIRDHVVDPDQTENYLQTARSGHPVGRDSAVFTAA